MVAVGGDPLKVLEEILLMIVGLAASVVPAVRASRVNVMEAMRSQ